MPRRAFVDKICSITKGFSTNYPIPTNPQENHVSAFHVCTHTNKALVTIHPLKHKVLAGSRGFCTESAGGAWTERVIGSRICAGRFAGIENRGFRLSGPDWDQVVFRQQMTYSRSLGRENLRTIADITPFLDSVFSPWHFTGNDSGLPLMSG